jgi:hypothetical protein
LYFLNFSIFLTKGWFPMIFLVQSEELPRNICWLKAIRPFFFLSISYFVLKRKPSYRVTIQLIIRFKTFSHKMKKFRTFSHKKIITILLRLSQLSPIERYAMKFVEETEGTWTAVQLNQIEEEIEQQKRDWEASRLVELKKEEEDARRAEKEDVMITYSRQDATNQVNSNRSHKSKLSNMRKQGFFKSNKRSKIIRGGKGAPTGGGSGSGRKVMLGKRKQLVEEKVNINTVTDKIAIANKKVPAVKPVSPKKTRANATASAPEKPAGPSPSPAKKRATNVSISKTSKENKPKSTIKKGRKQPEIENDETEVKPKPTKSIQSKKTGVSSTATSHAAEESNSECSLDVMIDSNDAAPAGNRGVLIVDENDDDSSNDASQSRTLNGDDSSILTEHTDDRFIDSDDEVLLKGKSHLKEPTHFDLSSPRTTRSRGSVKINLWTLDDESPIMAPGAGFKRLNRTGSGRKNKKSKTVSTSEEVDESQETITGDIDYSSRLAEQATEEESNVTFDENINLNASLASEKELKVVVKKSTPKILDGFNVVARPTSTPKARGGGAKNKRNSLNASFPSPQSPAANNTLDSWICKLPTKPTISTSEASTTPTPVSIVANDSVVSVSTTPVSTTIMKVPDARYSRRQSIAVRAKLNSENGTL